MRCGNRARTLCVATGVGSAREGTKRARRLEDCYCEAMNSSRFIGARIVKTPLSHNRRSSGRRCAGTAMRLRMRAGADKRYAVLFHAHSAVRTGREKSRSLCGRCRAALALSRRASRISCERILSQNSRGMRRKSGGGSSQNARSCASRLAVFSSMSAFAPNRTEGGALKPATSMICVDTPVRFARDASRCRRRGGLLAACGADSALLT